MMLPKAYKSLNRFSKWMMALSLPFVITGLVFVVHTYFFLQQVVPGKGTIIQLMERPNDAGDMLYAAVFTFFDADGQQHKIVSSTASNPPIGDVGDDIAILYDPNDPENAEEDRFINLWGPAVIFTGLGSFYFIMFWSVAYFTKRRMQSANQVREATP